jgi:Cu(I)/Ag(I) efflux system membrane fusion protein
MIPQQIEALAKRGTASENIEVIAPQDGVVVSLSVREGMYVQPNTTIMSLADLSSVWLQAEVFESQADWVATGQAVEARLDYLPGTVFSGQVDYVYPVLDPVTRTLKVRLKFDNPQERLKPNMYAKVSIYGRLKPNALSIPREALIRAPGMDRVVVSVGDGQFHVREVMTGLESGEFVEVLAGISAGDEVVTSAQFLIDSEASLAGSIKRLESMADVPPAQELEAVFASGRVDAVDSKQRRIRISHGPIDVLGWPSMTMEFPAKAAVDLSQVNVGQEIRFALIQEQAGEYAIEQLFSDAGKFGVHSTVQTNQTEPLGDSPGAGPSGDGQKFTGRAVVIGVDVAAHQVKLEHEAITALKWPAMTMSFDVMATVDLAPLTAGQDVHFSLVKRSDGSFAIDQIHVMNSDTDDKGRADD